jgi:hypothetical protein
MKEMIINYMVAFTFEQNKKKKKCDLLCYFYVTCYFLLQLVTITCLQYL